MAKEQTTPKPAPKPTPKPTGGTTVTRTAK